MPCNERENCVQVVADTVLVDGIPVAILLEGAPVHFVAAFRRCIDSADFSKQFFRERDEHRVRKAI